MERIELCLSTVSGHEVIRNLVKCIQESNKGKGKYKESNEHWKKKYKELYQEHLALISALWCDRSQARAKATEEGKTYGSCEKYNEKE